MGALSISAVDSMATSASLTVFSLANASMSMKPVVSRASSVEPAPEQTKSRSVKPKVSRQPFIVPVRTSMTEKSAGPTRTLVVVDPAVAGKRVMGYFAFDSVASDMVSLENEVGLVQVKRSQRPETHTEVFTLLPLPAKPGAGRRLKVFIRRGSATQKDARLLKTTLSTPLSHELTISAWARRSRKTR